MQRIGWPAWLQPTLARRLVAALFLAVALLAALVLIQDQLDIRQALRTDPGVRQLGRQLAAGLEELDDSAMAARVLVGHARHLQRLRQGGSALLQGALLFQLYDRKGHLVYASAPAEPIVTLGVGTQQLAGTRHWTYRQDGPRWSLRIAEPAITQARLLGFASWELGKQLLLAFPLMLLPLWLAVWTGLAPLRRLARRLEALDTRRSLAPLGVDLRYAELRPLGRAFDALLQRLRERLAREQAFVHDAAHELRTPLAVVAAQAHLLVQAPDAEARSAAAAALRRAIARSAHLSQQLLDLASLDQQRQPGPETIDLAQLTAQLLASQAPLARSRAIDLALDAPPRLILQIERGPMLSVLQNLLDNALRYTAPGGRVELVLRADEHGVTLAVADDGPGIAEADRERAFERFWRGPGHDMPGTGLGLAIVREAALRLGARLSLGPGLDGRGLRVELGLPRLATPDLSILGIP